MKRLVQKRTHRRRRGSALAEFGPTLWMFLILFLIPFLDLLSFGWGVGMTMFMANMAARNAAGAATWQDAQTAVTNTESSMRNLMAFAKMSPQGGGTSGMSLAMVMTPMSGGASKVYTAPTANLYSEPDSNAADPNNLLPNSSNTVYTWLVTAKYNVLPLFNFSGTPFLSGVPALGAPVVVNFTSNATVEHPDGLNNTASGS